MTEEKNSLQWLVWALPPIWRQRWVILRITAAGLLVSAIITFCVPALYTSTVRLMPPDAQSKASLGMMASALSGISAPMATGGLAGLVNARSPDATFLAILASRSAQDYLINRFDLRKVYHYKLYLDTRKKLARRTDITEDKKTGVVTISVTDRNPIRARNLAAAYVDELNNLVVLMDTSSAHRERIFLEQRLKAVKQDLNTATGQLSHFSSQNATMDVQRQATVMLDATTRLQGELIAEESQLSGLEAIYSSENARVRAVRARVDTLKQQLRKMGGDNHATSSGINGDQLYPSLRQLPLLGATYSDLYRRVAIEDVIFEVLTKQYELAKVYEAKEIPTVTVLDPPNLPEKRSFPPRAAFIVGGTLLALLGGMGWVVFEDRWRNTGESNPARAVLIELRLRLQRTQDSPVEKVSSK